MKIKVKIIGAGSIGNHLAQASRRKGWDVTVVDINQDALERMKNDIYPSRYGKWDAEIKLCAPKEAPKGGFEIICVGTPPDARMKIALEALKEDPEILQLEKPYFVPMVSEEKQAENQAFLDELKKHEIKVVVGYEYALGEGAKKMVDFIVNNDLGDVRLLEVEVREEWSGIFSAHHWLAGPHETYLGFWKKGGGASGEHSHAIHYWQYFADLLGLGKATKVSAAMKMVSNKEVDYDAISYMNIITDQGFNGRIVQDVVTDPPYLSMLIQREKGFVKWLRRGVPGKGNVETITYGEKDKQGQWQIREEDIVVKRPDDFYHEICHIADVLEGKIDADKSPLSIESGLQATKVLTAAHNSRLNNSVFCKV